MGSTYMLTFATFLSIFVGFCTYLNVLMNDFNAIGSRLQTELNEKSNSKVQKILSEHIQFHYDILR